MRKNTKTPGNRPFLHTTAGRISGTLIQALRHLGQDQIDDTVIAILRRHVATADHAVLRKDLVHAPVWIADLLLPLMESPH